MCSILRYDSPSCLDVFCIHELLLNIVLRVEKDRSTVSVNEALYLLITDRINELSRDLVRRLTLASRRSKKKNSSAQNGSYSEI